MLFIANSFYFLHANFWCRQNNAMLIVGCFGSGVFCSLSTFLEDGTTSRLHNWLFYECEIRENSQMDLVTRTINVLGKEYVDFSLLFFITFSC